MPIPSNTLTIQDGSLGISPPASGNVSVVMGVCSKGTPSTVYGAYRDITTMVTALGYGPAVEAAALEILTGGTVYVVAVDPSYDGAASTVTFVGSGAGRVSTPTFAPAQQITITCTTAGNLGTAAFTYKLGTGATSSPVTSVAGATWVWKIPGTLTKLTLTQGTGFDATDAWTISTAAVVTQTVNPGPGSGSLAHTSSQPFDDYTGKVEITATGAEGVGTFRYTLDNFADASGVDLSTWSPDIIIPAGLTYALPNTGVVLTFSSASYTDGDTHAFTTIASGFSTSNCTAAFTALYAQSSLSYGFGHTVGMSTSAANAATLAGIIDSNLSTAASAFRYLRWFMDCPTAGTRVLSGGVPIADTADTDSVLAAAFAALDEPRVVWGAGDFLAISGIDGRLCRRPASWAGAARCASARISQNLHRVRSGPIKNARLLYRNEESTQALDAGRFLTLRTHGDKPGFYITYGRSGANNTSDFKSLANGRVMDRMCQIGRSKGVDLIGESIATNSDGTIKEVVAQAIEADIRTAIRDGMTGDIVIDENSPYVYVSRTQNVLSTETLPITLRVTPFASANFVEETLGFVIPSAA
jgi:hypothetical protein